MSTEPGTTTEATIEPVITTEAITESVANTEAVEQLIKANELRQLDSMIISYNHAGFFLIVLSNVTSVIILCYICSHFV